MQLLHPVPCFDDVVGRVLVLVQHGHPARHVGKINACPWLAVQDDGCIGFDFDRLQAQGLDVRAGEQLRYGRPPGLELRIDTRLLVGSV